MKIPTLNDVQLHSRLEAGEILLVDAITNLTEEICCPETDSASMDALEEDLEILESVWANEKNGGAA